MAFESAAVRSFPTVLEMSNSLGEFVAESAEAAIAARGKFMIAISGGSQPEFIVSGLKNFAEHGKDINMDKWHFFYVDERIVPLDSEESNHHGAAIIYRRPYCNTPDENIHTIDPSLEPEACAADYQAKIEAAFEGPGIPSFDLILLGMGEDGHTASLFPDHPLLEEESRLVAAITDSPKPPAARVTFTYPLINAARKVGVVTAGASKAVAFGRVHHTRTLPDPTLPCMRIRPESGPAVWFVDHDVTRTMEDDIDRSGK